MKTVNVNPPPPPPSDVGPFTTDYQHAHPDCQLPESLLLWLPFTFEVSRGRRGQGSRRRRRTTEADSSRHLACHRRNCYGNLWRTKRGCPVRTRLRLSSICKRETTALTTVSFRSEAERSWRGFRERRHAVLGTGLACGCQRQLRRYKLEY